LQYRAAIGFEQVHGPPECAIQPGSARLRDPSFQSVDQRLELSPVVHTQLVETLEDFDRQIKGQKKLVD
jgi:hypothetical protein